ncbi:MAG: hypothetical protein RLZZ417_1098 [Bacteroidota bacterium]|jgi:hypothetical protein
MKNGIVILLAFLLFQPLKGQDTLELIAPDRPGFGDAVFITPTKYLMIETGFWTENQKEVGSSIQNTRGTGLNSTLLRYGVSRKFELRFDYTLWQERLNMEALKTGFQPARVGFKYALLENNGAIPAVTLIGMTGFPFSTSSYFRTNGINPSLELSFANSLTDWMTLCYNLGSAWDGDNKNPAYYYALSLEMAISNKFGCYLQGHGDSQKIELDGNSNQINQTFIEGGILYFPKNNIQLDISAGRSVGTIHTYSFLTCGFSIRIPN